MCRETIIDNENYTVDLEYRYDTLFLHCDVHHYNKGILADMVRDWMDMEEALRNEGFEYVVAIPKKNGFVRYTGWEHLDTVNYFGRDWGIYLWDLRQQ